MSILFVKRRIEADKAKLTEIVLNMDKVRNMVSDKISLYKDHAETVAQGLEAFKRIVNNHKDISFQYRDVLNSELKRYKKGEVITVCSLDGKKYLTPFNMLEKACVKVIKYDGTMIPYPADLKIGNRAIGQAWLEDGTEVFSPRHAFEHSITATARMLRSWAIDFQERMSELK